MSASLRKFRALIYDYSDTGTGGEMVATYSLISSGESDDAWWCARANPTGHEVTTGMQPQHRLDAILNFSAYAPIEVDSAVVVDEVEYLVRAILARDYGRDELQVYAERQQDVEDASGLNLVDLTTEPPHEPDVMVAGAGAFTVTGGAATFPVEDEVEGGSFALSGADALFPSSDVVSITGVTLHRFTGSTSSVRGWSGVPLAPGLLFPGATDNFRLLTVPGGVEIPIYIEEQGGRHDDGSLMSVYVEWDRTLAVGTPETVSIEIGTPRNTANDLTRTKASGFWDGLLTTDSTDVWKTASFPDAIMNFPASYLATTQFWGPYDLRYKGQSGGPSWQASYFSTWEAGADTWWNLWTSYSVPSGAVASFAIPQYDRPAQFFKLWAMTGDADYYARACASLIDWRNRYFRKYTPTSPGSGIAMWEHCPWGLAFHYLLTGDNSSRTDLANQAWVHSNPALVIASLDDYDSEPRPLAFELYALCAAKMIQATPVSGTWDARITAWLAKWLPPSAGHPGWITSGPYAGAFWNKIMYNCASLTSSSQLTQNFMLALLANAIDQYLTFGDGTYATEAEARLEGLADFMLTQAGTNSNGVYTVKYNNQSLGCGQQGATFVNQVNLNGLFAGAFGAAYARLGTASYQTAARALLETTTFTPNTGNSGPYIHNQARAHNETFHQAPDALGKVYP